MLTLITLKHFLAQFEICKNPFISSILNWPVLMQCFTPTAPFCFSSSRSKSQSKCQRGVWCDDKWLNPTAELLTGTKMWRQNSCGTGVEWKLLSTLIAPRPLTRFFLGSPVLRVTERWWTPQHTLSVPIIKAQRDCQGNAPHNNWLHKFRRLKQHFRPCRLIAVSVQLSYRETFFFQWRSALSPVETAGASADFVTLERICKCAEMEFIIQNCSAQWWHNKWQQLELGRKNLQSIFQMKVRIMRPVSLVDLRSKITIGTSPTSWMAFWLMALPQVCYFIGIFRE